MMNPVLIRNSKEWDAYIVSLDVTFDDGKRVPYKHDHSGTPSEFPCIVVSEFWDDPNGPYSYDHTFVYKGLADQLCAAAYIKD